MASLVFNGIYMCHYYIVMLSGDFLAFRRDAVLLAVDQAVFPQIYLQKQ
jgi:hypothetical protein